MKKITIIVTLLMLGFLGWYFLLKSYDYQVTFNTSNPSGVVFNTISAWNFEDTTKKNNVTTYAKIPFSKLRQELSVSDSLINIDWDIVKTSDSITKVIAYVTDKNNSLIQKLKVPFMKTDFVNRSISIVKKIKEKLDAYKDRYKVGTIEISKIPQQYCAYISIESKLSEKANKMMANNSYIISYLEANNIKISGHPFLEVTKWNIIDNTISFNFCFPIPFSKDYKSTNDIKFKTTKEQPALKTVFNGNYRISDCAWFSIIDYAERNDIKIEKLPTEIFFDDPHSGGNELQWQSEIYMPISTN